MQALPLIHFAGIKNVLLERGKWPIDSETGEPSKKFLLHCNNCEKKIPDDPGRLQRIDCCASRLLGPQPDFLQQKSYLEEVITGMGCEILFLPKFHCEINFIGG